jgi:hypothetical protein
MQVRPGPRCSPGVRDAHEQSGDAQKQWQQVSVDYPGKREIRLRKCASTISNDGTWRVSGYAKIGSGFFGNIDVKEKSSATSAAASSEPMSVLVAMPRPLHAWIA